MAEAHRPQFNGPVDIAGRLLRLAEDTVGISLPIRLGAGDGSEAEVDDTPVLIIPDVEGAAAHHVVPASSGSPVRTSRATSMSTATSALHRDVHPPEMHMTSLAKTIGLIGDAGLEIRDVQAMREHYPQTVAAWSSHLQKNRPPPSLSSARRWRA